MKQYKNIQFAFVIMFGCYGTLYTLLFSFFKLNLIQSQELIGKLCAIHNYIYYGKYLPQLYIIIRKKDASSIIPCLMVADIFYSIARTTYGILLDNSNIYIPSGIGIIVSFTFLFTYFIYGFGGKSKEDTSIKGNDGNGNKNKNLNVVDDIRFLELEGQDMDKDMEMMEIKTNTKIFIGNENKLDTYLNQPVKFEGNGDDDEITSKFMEIPDDKTGIAIAHNYPLRPHLQSNLNLTSQLMLSEIMDNSMQWMANVGRSRSNSLMIDPAEEKSSNDISTTLNENITIMNDMSEHVTLANTNNISTNVKVNVIKECINCNNKIFIQTARFCWHCGYSVVPSQLLNIDNMIHNTTGIEMYQQSPAARSNSNASRSSIITNANSNIINLFNSNSDNVNVPEIGNLESFTTLSNVIIPINIDDNESINNSNSNSSSNSNNVITNNNPIGLQTTVIHEEEQLLPSPDRKFI